MVQVLTYIAVFTRGMIAVTIVMLSSKKAIATIFIFTVWHHIKVITGELVNSNNRDVFCGCERQVIEITFEEFTKASGVSLIGMLDFKVDDAIG